MCVIEEGYTCVGEPSVCDEVCMQSNEGVEVCDDVDNNCNGMVDEELICGG